MLGKLRSRRCLVPVQREQIVPDYLLVKTVLAPAGGVVPYGPEARGIGRKELVYQEYLSSEHAELHLRVGYDDALFLGYGARGLVDLKAYVPQFLRRLPWCVIRLNPALERSGPYSRKRVVRSCQKPIRARAAVNVIVPLPAK